MNICWNSLGLAIGLTLSMYRYVTQLLKIFVTENTALIQNNQSFLK